MGIGDFSGSSPKAGSGVVVLLMSAPGLTSKDERQSGGESFRINPSVAAWLFAGPFTRGPD